MPQGLPRKVLDEQWFSYAWVEMRMGEAKVQSSLFEELRLMRERLDKIENLLERRLIDEVKPTKEELKAVADYETLKRRGKLRFISPSKFCNSLTGLHQNGKTS